MPSINLRLGLTLWIAGMAGVAALAFTVLPQLHAKTPTPSLPLGGAIAASMVQSGLLLTLAVWLGIRLAKPLGFGAPVLEALFSGSGAGAALKRLLLPTIAAGIVTAGLLYYLGTVAPTDLQDPEAAFHIPLAAKLLYGGITEELLMRWGLMTLLVWLPWRFLQQRNGLPRGRWIAFGVLVSALLFAAGHLPAVVAMKAPLTAPVVTYVLAGNALPGILFGILYWRRGIEASILAHALAHAVAVLVFL